MGEHAKTAFDSTFKHGQLEIVVNTPRILQNLHVACLAPLNNVPTSQSTCYTTVSRVQRMLPVLVVLVEKSLLIMLHVHLKKSFNGKER